MRVVIIGSGELPAALARRVHERGDEVAGLGPSRTDGWPAGVPYTVFDSVALLSDALVADHPAVVVVFGPDRLERPAIPPVEIVRAVAALDSARLIYWGSAFVYGRPQAVQGCALLELAPLAAGGRSASAAEADEAVQSMVAEGQGGVHLFRAAEVVGGQGSPPLDGLGALTIVPTPSNHRHLQLLDQRDAVEVLDRALKGGNPGIYNVSADGIVKVDDACRAMGRSTIRLPRVLLTLAAYGARGTGRVRSARELLRLTRGSPVLDNSRLKTHFGFRPRFTTRGALAAARDNLDGRDS